MYIFLDIDGVLNTYNDFSKKPYTLNKECVDNFLQFIHKVNEPKIILTSSWRKGFEKDYNECSPQIQKLIDKGINIFDKTAISPNKDRAAEINYYLRRHEKDDYIVIDDDINEYKSQINNLYLTDYKKGFSKKDIKKVKKLCC